jgi:hypothetical protein
LTGASAPVSIQGIKYVKITIPTTFKHSILCLLSSGRD